MARKSFDETSEAEVESAVGNKTRAFIQSVVIVRLRLTPRLIAARNITTAGCALSGGWAQFLWHTHTFTHTSAHTCMRAHTYARTDACWAGERLKRLRAICTSRIASARRPSARAASRSPPPSVGSASAHRDPTHGDCHAVKLCRHLGLGRKARAEKPPIGFLDRQRTRRAGTSTSWTTC